MSEVVYIGLGANLGDPAVQAIEAIERIKSLPKTDLIKLSSFYRSKPLGPSDQPDYLNCIICIETELTPLELLDELQNIELELGRIRKAERWGPRTLDLDILLYGQQVIQSDRLTIPHYDMHNREFVLYPLFEISPDLIFPNSIPLNAIISKIPSNGLVKWYG